MSSQSRRRYTDTNAGLLNALIEAHTHLLNALIAQQAVTASVVGRSVPAGQLQPLLYELLGLTVLPVSPAVLVHWITLKGYVVRRSRVYATLDAMRRAGLVVSFGRGTGKWRRADLDQREREG